jgi:glycosyltransferase involved in cell wall biosynthesis
MKPRVLMIISFFYPHLGGAEQQALRLAVQLTKRGVHVAVLTRKFKGFPSCEVIKGIPVYRHIRTLPWGKSFALTYMLSVFWFLLKKRHAYDIIHCHLLQGFHSVIAIVFKALFQKKVVIKVGATGPISDFIMIKKVFLGEFLLKRITLADRLITVCAQSTEEALQAGFSSRQVVQIPNGVDTTYFKVLTPVAELRAITFIGRLDHLKGVYVLIEALKKLKDDGVDAHLNVIGDGPDRDKLQNLSRDVGVNDSISFCGAVEEIIPYLQKSTLFVLPSLSEGLSNVLLEAMACGLPIIATRVGGNIDLIRDGENGLLVEPENSEQLSAAIKKILQDKDLAQKLGMEARKTAEEKFSMEIITNNYVSLYQELMGTGVT